MKRLLALILVAFAGVTAGLVTPAAARADASGDSAAIAVNTRDGASIFRLAFSVRRAMGDVVDNSNAAVAYASCVECQTVAIAVQIVLVAGDAEQVTTSNLALAVNQECTLCETLAAAYQFVLGDGTLVRFTAEGQRELAQIRRAFLALGRGDLSIEEIATQADLLAGRLRAVLDTQLVPVPGRGPSDAEPRTPSGGDGDDGSGTTTGPGSMASPGTTTETGTSTDPGTTSSPGTTTETTTSPGTTTGPGTTTSSGTTADTGATTGEELAPPPSASTEATLDGETAPEP